MLPCIVELLVVMPPAWSCLLPSLSCSSFSSRCVCVPLSASFYGSLPCAFQETLRGRVDNLTAEKVGCSLKPTWCLFGWFFVAWCWRPVCCPRRDLQLMHYCLNLPSRRRCVCLTASPASLQRELSTAIFSLLFMSFGSSPFAPTWLDLMRTRQHCAVM